MRTRDMYSISRRRSSATDSPMPDMRCRSSFSFVSGVMHCNTAPAQKLSEMFSASLVYLCISGVHSKPA